MLRGVCHSNRVMLVGLTALLSICTASVGWAKPSAPKVPGNQTNTVTVIPYEGSLVDEAGKPISGIYPMEFKLYKGTESKKAIWSDFMWVSVEGGVYVVRIGANKKLPANFEPLKLVLGVDIRGVGEIYRAPLAGPQGEGSSGPAIRVVKANAAPGGTHVGEAKYADSAGFAVEAEHAKNSDRIQNLTVEDIVRKISEEGGVGGGGGDSKAKVGRARRYGNRVGGPGGVSEFNEMCPKGYVMTGLRGAAGNFIDAVQIVCSPLE